MFNEYFTFLIIKLEIEMKKISVFSFLIALILFLSFAPVFAPRAKPSLSAVTPTIKSSGFIENEINISAQKAILMHKDTGFVLYSKNADLKSGMASTTKIMTAIVVLENLPLDKEITITKESVGVEGSSIYLSEGEIFKTEDLLHGLLLESGNDAATALAIATAETVEEFSSLMNKKAKEIGMENTNYVNPHGLSNENHYTTARDMGILSSYAMNNDTFRKIVSTQKANIKPQNSEYIRYCVNHNNLLWTYEGATGIKTGYTKADGRCLVSSAVKDGIELICVTLNGPDNWNDHKTLLDKGFEKFKKRTLAQKGEYAFEISVVGGTKNYISATNVSNVSLPLPKESNLDFKVVTPPFVYAPIKKGDIVGEVRIYCEGMLIYSIPLCSNENVEVKKVSLFKKIFG